MICFSDGPVVRPDHEKVNIALAFIMVVESRMKLTHVLKNLKAAVEMKETSVDFPLLRQF